MIASMNLSVIGQIIKASSDAPYLSLKLEFNENARRAMFVGQMESSIQDAVLRLVRLLDTPGEIPFLAPLYSLSISQLSHQRQTKKGQPQ
ncbi:AraC family transcriptional regulator [Paenibacillus amylolyticus]|uniref:AraC family transcriptional regulator n=1 Tax=Paenibacillus amylolyticus TaxID=1451 RepID=UPI003BB1ABC3